MNIVRIIIILFFIIIFYNSIYFVNNYQNCIITRLEKNITIRNTPNLYLKIPFIDSCVYTTKKYQKIVNNNMHITYDKKNISIEYCIIYKIKDPIEFYNKLKSKNSKLKDILINFTDSKLRNVIGQFAFNKIITDINNIKKLVNDSSNSDLITYGIEMDFFIIKTSLSDEINSAIYNRMRSERFAQAQEYRAMGFEQASSITANADKKCTIILANAFKESKIIKNKGDERVEGILDEIYKKDSDFFFYIKTMNIYKEVIKNKDINLNPKIDFLQLFKNPK